VKAECSVGRSVQRRGERSEMKHLLLCAVPEVIEWRECSEGGRRNDWNEVNGGTWQTLSKDIYQRRQKANVSLQCNDRDSFVVQCLRLFD
jgi:hypothetical protein